MQVYTCLEWEMLFFFFTSPNVMARNVLNAAQKKAHAETKSFLALP